MRNYRKEVKPALCLDLDGTVRYSASGDFIQKIDDIRLFHNVEEKIWEYRNNNYLIFGISNQAGVAYGFKSPFEIEKEINKMFNLFNKNPFHMIRCCYHHEKGKKFPFNYRSLSRKPNYGMLAICEYEAYNKGFIVNWNKSLFVGDRQEDEDCAKSAQIQFIHADVFFERNRKKELTKLIDNNVSENKGKPFTETIEYIRNQLK